LTQDTRMGGVFILNSDPVCKPVNESIDKHANLCHVRNIGLEIVSKARFKVFKMTTDRTCIFASVAQLVEHPSRKGVVAGSIPVTGSTLRGLG
jgi:hypothetical protein